MVTIAIPAILLWKVPSRRTQPLDAAAFGAPWGNEQPDALYGDMLGSVRVDYYTNWINATVPEPASMTALAIGLVGLLARRRGK